MSTQLLHQYLVSQRIHSSTAGEFLKVPVLYASHNDFEVAQTAPKVKIIFLGFDPAEGEPYGTWGSLVRGPDGNFYFAVGNHKSGSAADAFLLRYSPATQACEVTLSTREVCGWYKDTGGDGKIHGSPDIAPNGDTWLLTFFGNYPKKSDWGIAYHGGWLIRHNVFTGHAECMGQPVPDDSWPLHRWDWQHERLYAIGEYGMFQDRASGDEQSQNAVYGWGKLLVYDTANRRLIRGQQPLPDDIHWQRRSLMLDAETGYVYGSEASATYRFIEYQAVTDTVRRMNAQLDAPLHSASRERTTDGAFLVFDYNGGFYKFFPAADRVVKLGMNWLNGTEILQDICISPDKRFAYYISASGLRPDPLPFESGMPVIQVDLRNHRKKVIAFLAPFIMQQHQFGLCAVYAIALSADGRSLVAIFNGDRDVPQYGQIAVVHIHIPESERT